MKHIIILYRNIRSFLHKNTEDNLSAISGQSAFFIMLSFVPFLMFTFAIMSFFDVPLSFFDKYIGELLLSDTSKLVRDIISESYKAAGGIAFTTIVIALWSSGKGIYSITEGIRRIYRISKKSNWFLKRVFAMGYTVLMFIVIIIMLSALFFSELLDDSIISFIKQLPYAFEVLYTLRYLVIFFVLTILLALALKLFLRGKVEDKRYALFRLQLPGAILTTVSWLLFSLGIRVYKVYFNGFSIYGSLATIILIMVWMYFSMYIFLTCIQINYVYREWFYQRFKFPRKKNK